MDILIICVITAMITIAECMHAPVPQRCGYVLQYKMYSADCAYRYLEQIPSTLKTNIELLDASVNRIRGELTGDNVKNYGDLKFLYLRDNFITRIQPDFFSELTDLEVLDLSTNHIQQLPPNLPSPFRRLYLSNNPVENLTLSSAYNLQYLELANCGLKKLPPLGVLPSLEELNVTENPLIELTPKDLARMCRLKKLHLPVFEKNTLYQQPGYECECHRLLTWTSQRYIDVGNYTCVKLADPDLAGCNTNTTTELHTWKECMAIQPAAAKTRNFLILAFITSLIIAVVVLGCWWHRRKRKTPVRSQKKPVSTLIT